MYIPPIGGTQEAAEYELKTTLKAFNITILQNNPDKTAKPWLITGGDFNRQDLLYSVSTVANYIT
jgi:hypothetical protein